MSKHKRLIERDKRICALRLQGYMQREIAAIVGCSEPVVGCVLRANNLGGVSDRGKALGHPKRNDGDKKRKLYQKPEQEVRKVIYEWSGGRYEYVCGYVNTSGKVTIRCTCCGTEIQKSFDSIRHSKNPVPCKICAEAKKEKEKIIKQLEKLLRNELRKKENELRKKEIEEARRHDCPVCGNSTTRRIYCSDKCAKKALYSCHEARRRHTIASATIDPDITLESLYRKDNGICYLCGCGCDWNDYKIKNGFFIAGNDYPSVDHVIPISKGGDHSWDNVRLAHRRCNTIKGARI